MQSWYVIDPTSDRTNLPADAVARSQELNCGLIIGDPTITNGATPTGSVLVFPSVVVISSVLAPAVFPDDTGEATTTQVLSAQTAATTAEATITTNATTIMADILTRQHTIDNWITANPSGAVLTGPQTLQLALMLNGLCKLLLQQFSSTTQT